MIDKALEFICDQLDNYLRFKIDPSTTSAFAQLENVAWKDAQSNSDTDANSVYISLVNIEEDRISKSQENFVRNNGNITYKNPKIFLNLYLLFSSNHSTYSQALERLSYVIQFFQYLNVFNPLTTPGNTPNKFPDGVDELIFDLYTLSFQDLNNLWGIMGSKYLPSVMYKMRLIVIDENFEQGTAGLINEIMINDKTINQ